ncbi:MAG: hypothetical protein HFG49_16610 [Lachnospiraceae bacterium]|jgi:hypothetical protein|nr:hypothetical protein [Lachnospiraceae bacterium]
MDKKTFCPFINGSCVSECMFRTISSKPYDDGSLRCCLIAASLSELPDSEHCEKALNVILSALKHQ